MAVPSPINPINYIIKRQYNETLAIKSTLFNERLSNATNLFQKGLLGHYGCVNAIEFSKDGELLISGGDDQRVLLWSVPHAVLEKSQPVEMQTPHLSNIFCLGIDSTNSKIYSAGNDEKLIVHDAKTGNLITHFPHQQPVYDLSVNPLDDNVLATASEEGKILVYDIRVPSTNNAAFCLATYTSPFYSVMFNPVDPRFVATSNAEEGIALWDNRKPKQYVIRYGTGNRRKKGIGVCFNSTGNQLFAVRNQLPPALYSVQSPKEICQFDAPDYYNSCTLKSSCFLGDKNEYVLTGSENYNLYMWKIPKDEAEWGSMHLVLLGHRSVVNHVRYNPQNNLIASSGVEKIVKLWSTLSIGGWEGSLFQLHPERSRRVFSHAEYSAVVPNSAQLYLHDYSDQTTSEDYRMIAYFDRLIIRNIEEWDISDDSDSLDYSFQVPPDSYRSLSDNRNKISRLIVQKKRDHLIKMASYRGKSSNKRPEKKRIEPSPHQHRYNTRSRTARECTKEEDQSNGSRDMPSTSTGIPASSRGTSTVYRIYDPDSDDDMADNSSGSTTESN